MKKSRKIIAIAIIFASQAIGSFHIALADELYGLPLPWNYVETIDTDKPWLMLPELELISGSYVPTQGYVIYFLNAVDSTTNFYINGNAIATSGPTYWGTYFGTDYSGNITGWSNSDCIGSNPPLNACYVSSGDIITYGSTAERDAVLSIAFSNRPIYTNSGLTTVAYQPNTTLKPIYRPNQSATLLSRQCGQTSFAIPKFEVAFGYTFPRVDFGQGICTAALDTFVPEDGYFQTQLETINDTLFEQAPFAYFEEVSDQITGIDTETTDADLTITLAQAFGPESGDLEVPILTAENPILADNADTIITWIIYFLWIGFATYLFFRIFYIFRNV